MKKTPLFFPVFFLLFISCNHKIPDYMVFVKGGTIEIGDDINHASYPAEVADFYISNHEVTNREFVEVYNWAFNRGYLYIARGKETKERPNFPHNIGEKFPDYLYVDTDYLVRLNQDNPWPLIEHYKKCCQIEFVDDVFRVKEGMEDYPVIDVSWYGAAAYCNFLSEMQGFDPVYETEFWDCNPKVEGYRLPSNEEWEYAARGGGESEGYIYSGGNVPDDVAWYASNSGGNPHPVMKKRSNELGLFDMSGNVWEFCNEKMGIFPGILKTGVMQNGLFISYRLWRGGGYLTDNINVHIFRQHIDLPSYLQGNDEVGFRVVYQM